MGSQTRLITYCTKLRENPANIVTSRNTNTRLVHPIDHYTSHIMLFFPQLPKNLAPFNELHLCCLIITK